MITIAYLSDCNYLTLSRFGANSVSVFFCLRAGTAALARADDDSTNIRQMWSDDGQGG